MRPSEFFKCEISKDFRSLSGELIHFCVNDGGHLIGWEHLKYFNNLSSPRIEKELINELSIPYVYLAAAFFCQDHVFDGDPHTDLEILAPTLFVSAASERLVTFASRQSYDVDTISSMLSSLMRDFACAMVEERHWMKAPHNTEDFSHVVGRSSLFLFGYKLLSFLKDISIDGTHLELLNQFIYFMQCGDDIGDWREDFKANKLTPTLADAYRQIGSENITEETLEEFVYLSGFYENKCRFVIAGLRDITIELKKLFGNNSLPLVEYVNMQIHRAEEVATRFSQVKAGLQPPPLRKIQ